MFAEQPELKPCPFCGSAAEYGECETDYPTEHKDCLVRCSNSYNDCIHYEVCKVHGMNVDDTNFRKEFCGCFKDKSRFIELPCKVGDKIYMIAGSGDEAFVADGRVKSIVFESECVWIYSIYDCGLTYHHNAGTGAYFFTKEEAEKKLGEMKK